jgi:hypothetical protein
VYRRWNSGLDGVYVKVTDKTQPNPYLANDPTREILGPGNTILTKINHAYMIRLVHELGELESGVLARKDIQPTCVPQVWCHTRMVSLSRALRRDFAAAVVLPQPTGASIGHFAGGVARQGESRLYKSLALSKGRSIIRQTR